MKIVYVASEAQPFAASGGLADVAGSLPKALAASGHELTVILPLYGKNMKQEYQDRLEFVTSFNVPVGWRSQYCGILKIVESGVTFLFVDNEYYFKRDFGLYGYYDDAERFAFFSRAVLEVIQKLDLQPEIINSNDWQAALVPVYYTIYYKYQHNMRNIRTVFTIHNIQYQGRYGHDLLEDVLGIPRHMASIVDYDGDVNLMKGAIEVSDKINTVSPSYANEILDPWFSHGLDRVLKNKRYKTCGFLNGIDTDMYNPATDKGIPATFSAKSKAGKKKCKEKLLEEVGLPLGDEPVLGIISRLVEHKGFDLIEGVFGDIVGLGFKVVILGSGDPKYERFFGQMAANHPGKVSFTCGYDPALAKKIYAGADFFLMPSKSEPCGLAQLIAIRYGTIPIVRAVGGLKDSITDCGDPDGIGFKFVTYNAHDMLSAVKRAAILYANTKERAAVVDRAMKADFSWNTSAKLYEGLYEELTSWNKT
ncbi:glycogen synthase [Clostridia bacterium]|nr:glycogen synthase [Clostridia bacterium]